MAVINNSIKRFRGDTYPIVVTLKENGKPVDLSTAVVAMHISRDPLITVTGTVISTIEAKVTFELQASEVDTVGKFTYDIQVDSGGYITTYVKDVFELIEDVG